VDTTEAALLNKASKQVQRGWYVDITPPSISNAPQKGLLQNEFKLGGGVWMSHRPPSTMPPRKGSPQNEFKRGTACGFHTAPHRQHCCGRITPKQVRRGWSVDFIPPRIDNATAGRIYPLVGGGFNDVEGAACGYHTALLLIWVQQGQR